MHDAPSWTCTDIEYDIRLETLRRASSLMLHLRTLGPYIVRIVSPSYRRLLVRVIHTFANGPIKASMAC